MTPFRRAALYARMIVALGVLLSFVVLLTLVFAGAGVLSLAVVAPYLVDAYSVVAQLPRLSAVVGLPPFGVAVAAFAYLYVSVRYAPTIADLLGVEYLLWPTTPVAMVTTGAALLAVYEVGVEFAVGVGNVVRSNLLWSGVVAVTGAAVAGSAVCLAAVRREMRRLREHSVEAATSDASLERRVTRLAAAADVRPPDVVVRDSATPRAFTVGTKANRTVVVTTGLVETLGDDELDAVLAHEVSHIANRDVTVMAATLAPILVAEESLAVEADDLGGVLLDAAADLLLGYGQFGAGVLSRGREYAADVGAAELTGNPGALATALATLSGDRDPPTTDLRESQRAVQALDVVPRPTDGDPSFRTHPPTEERIARLRELERRLET